MDKWIPCKNGLPARDSVGYRMISDIDTDIHTDTDKDIVIDTDIVIDIGKGTGAATAALLGSPSSSYTQSDVQPIIMIEELHDNIFKEAADLVRCAECRYLAVQNTKYLYAICHRHGIEFKPFEDDTRTHGCSWGERKESE